MYSIFGEYKATYLFIIRAVKAIYDYDSQVDEGRIEISNKQSKCHFFAWEFSVYKITPIYSRLLPIQNE